MVLSKSDWVRSGTSSSQSEMEPSEPVVEEEGDVMMWWRGAGCRTERRKFQDTQSAIAAEFASGSPCPRRRMLVLWAYLRLLTWALVD